MTSSGSEAATGEQTERTLDPVVLERCRDLVGLLFPWDMNRALELALLKTFCLPSISGLLHQTGEFEQRPRKRYDDTALIVAELVRLGPDTSGGRAIIKRLNRIHSTYTIRQEDYAYVLSGFVAEPIRWIESFGWRALQPLEQEALFLFWDHVGSLMHLEQRPRSLRELMELNQHTNLELFACAESNQQVADATVAMLLAPWPAPFHPWLRSTMRCLLEPETLSNLNWPSAPVWQTHIVRVVLHCRSFILCTARRFWAPQRRGFFSERPTSSYGQQFTLEQIGPPSLLPRLNNSHNPDD
ncbi:DUF2236 domain-containing protein [Synechococcus sp. Cu2B8-bc1011]|uniref:DUF2236 domain-containing protein n=1 Tax=Synechococcus sp. Cu2B8-bc1011 TaxID=3093725 RepID=UPI0039B08588